MNPETHGNESWEQRLERNRNEVASKAHSERESKARIDELESGEFDPAMAMVENTLRDNYDSEVARLMGVKPGEKPEQALDRFAFKIYEQHLKDKETNIQAAMQRLAEKAANKEVKLDDLDRQTILQEIDSMLFS